MTTQAVRDRDRPFNLVFLSGHHRPTHEMAIRCQEVGIQLSLPPEETQGTLRRYVTKQLIPWLGLEAYGVHYYESFGDLRRAVEENGVDAFMVSLPEHLELVPEHFGPIPIAAEHMVNRYEDYRARGLQNFLSPSRNALALMNLPNQALTIKVRDFTVLDRTISTHSVPVRQRRGFYSYIDHYEDRARVQARSVAHRTCQDTEGHASSRGLRCNGLGCSRRAEHVASTARAVW